MTKSKISSKYLLETGCKSSDAAATDAVNSGKKTNKELAALLKGSEITTEKCDDMVLKAMKVHVAATRSGKADVEPFLKVLSR